VIEAYSEKVKEAPTSVKGLFVGYKLVRGLYTSIYFYFFPLFVIFLPIKNIIFKELTIDIN